MIVVKTDPDDNETSLDQLTFIDEREELRKCFICGAAKRLYADNFGETRLQNSETRVRDLIQICLGEMQSTEISKKTRMTKLFAVFVFRRSMNMI